MTNFLFRSKEYSLKRNGLLFTALDAIGSISLAYQILSLICQTIYDITELMVVVEADVSPVLLAVPGNFNKIIYKD